LRDFRRLRKQFPDNPDYLYGVGMLAMHGERWAEARGAWQALRGQGGDRHDEATYFLAQVEEQAGKVAVAIGLYRSVGEGPLYVDARLRLAGLEAGQGRLDQARELLRALRVAVPDRAVDAYLAEARLLRRAGRGEAAGRVLDDAVDAQPDNIDLRYGRAMHAARMDDVAALERDLRYVLTLEPDHVDALNALGYTLADRTDRYAEAFDYISRAYRLQPENPAIIDSLGWVYYRLGNHQLAIRYLRQALEAMHDPEIAAHLYEVLWVTGEREEARRVWRKAKAAFPDSPELRDVRQRFE
jgi:tetratricopeptide (TPR) repeat protein